MQPEEKAVDHIMSADAAARPVSDAAPLPIVLKIPWLATDAPSTKVDEPELSLMEPGPIDAVLPISRAIDKHRGRRSRRIVTWLGGCLVGVGAALACDQSPWFHEAAAQLGFGRMSDYNLRPSPVMPPTADGDPRIPDDPAPVQAVMSNDELGAATLAPEIIPIDDPRP